MALGTKWQARVSTQLAKNLTNPDDASATSVDTTRLDAAVADVGGAFRVYAQTAYDDDDARHVDIGVRGVTAYLMSYGSAPGGNADTAMRAFRDDLAALRRVTSRGRTVPKTDSPFTRTSEGRTGQTVRPNFDTRHFEGLIPDDPRGSPDGDSRLDNP